VGVVAERVRWGGPLLPTSPRPAPPEGAVRPAFKLRGRDAERISRREAKYITGAELVVDGGLTVNCV
jgi:NAD(P)-dependent dehydrogenase (short-subunit alcohol dehydrogenase family)